jgi:hypothetical protein
MMQRISKNMPAPRSTTIAIAINRFNSIREPCARSGGGANHVSSIPGRKHIRRDRGLASVRRFHRKPLQASSQASASSRKTMAQ